MIRIKQTPTLQRVAFQTSRLAEFCSIKELTAQTGHGPEEWPLVIAKELLDNALDACEEAEIAPEISIEVSTERGEIVITDNGPGLPAETISGTLDYNVRVSSREAYVSPSRGQQGNALKCIIAMSYALDGTCGTTLIEAHGQAHRITFKVDPIRREPRITRDVSRSLVQKGTRITARWRENACGLLVDGKRRFVQAAAAYTTFNPHLAIRGRWNGEEFINVVATNPGWRKWRTRDPTSAHWYNVESFSRYAAAHIARDQDQGRRGRRVRDFIAELAGLSRSGKQKHVLFETGTSGVALETFFSGGREAITRLLDSCKRHTKPVKPESLGIIGEDHLLAYCRRELGVAEESFRYRKRLGSAPTGLPYVIETAFGYCPEGQARRLITGINFAAAIGSPFERLGPFSSLTGTVEHQHVEHDSPVVLIAHFVMPAVQFADRGKGIVALPSGAGGEIIAALKAVTQDWDKQARAEIRSANARYNRHQRLLKELKHSLRREAAEPTGALAEKITAVADELGVSIDSLAVLSPSNDPYLAWRKRREAEWFEAVFNRFVPGDATKHLRGIFYLVVVSPHIMGPDGKPFVNDYKHWRALQNAAKAARWLGLVPFARIIDERNAPPEIYVPGVTPISAGVHTGEECEIPPTLEAALPQLSLTGFKGRQTHRIIFYGEKSSLAVVLRPIAERIGAEMILVTGESSDTHIAGMAKRASEDGRPAVVMYLNDFDPSGHQMPVSVARKLQAQRDLYYPDLNIKLYPVALTIDQVRALDLPSAPLKKTEKRAARWRERMGHEQTEIDALVELHPEALRAAVFEAIRPFYDTNLGNRVAAAERKWRKEAEAALHSHPEYEDVRRRIDEAWGRVQEAVGELRSEQREATRILEDSVPPAPDLPEAEPKGEGRPALFDSETDFVTATRQLIRRKKLIGMSDRGPPS
jgi:DNA topoisomerase VI subunit B